GAQAVGWVGAGRRAPAASAASGRGGARAGAGVGGAPAAARRGREALALRLRHGGEAHLGTAYARYVLGGMLVALGEFDEAAGLIESARRRFDEALGESHPRYASALESLALPRVGPGEQREAEALARRAP